MANVPGPGMGIGGRFQEETKYSSETVGSHKLGRASRPEAVKVCPDPLAIVPLPPPEHRGAIWELLGTRRSRRLYDPAPALELEALASLLWACQGITAVRGRTLFRTAPSAGALHPVETYCAIRAVKGLEPGVYHFRADTFELECLSREDPARPLSMAALGQSMVAEAQITMVWSAVIRRCTWKYRERAYRYIYLDAGHVAQNLYLAAEALGLGVCAVGAFFDDDVNAVVGLDGVEETAIYLASVGIPRRTSPMEE